MPVPQWVQGIAVAIMVVALMSAVGLDLTFRQVGDAFKQPLDLARGLFVTVVVTPLWALATVWALDLEPAVAAGVFLLGAAGGGPFGAWLVQHARGDLAYSVSLMVVLNILNPVLAPLIMAALTQGLTGSEPVPVLGMMRTLVLFILLPLTLSMTLRHKKPEMAAKLLRGIQRVNVVAMLIAGGIVAVSNIHMASMIGPWVYVGLTVSAGGMLAIGYFAAPKGKRVALGLTNCVRNVGVVFLLATAWYSDPLTTVSCMVYGVLIYFVAAAFAVIRRAKFQAEAA